MISLYMDSVFARGGVPDEVRPLHTIPPTIARLYLLAMREHERDAAIRCPYSGATEWQRLPDWRLDRWTIRLGLYLEERAGLEQGDRVAVLSELRPEWVVADLAALTSGAVAVGIDPELPDTMIRDVLADVAPRVLLASAEQLARIDADGRTTSLAEHVISFDSPTGAAARRMSRGVEAGVRAGDNVASLSAAIDLGGTLDTPERASVFRERAREIAPDAPALRHHQRTDDGATSPIPRDIRRVGEAMETHDLSQGGVIELLRPLWNEWPAARDDIALVAGPGVDFGTRLAIHSFIGDGRTCVALGDGRRLAEDAAAARPHKIMAPPAALARLADDLPHAEPGSGGSGGGVGGIVAMLRALTRAAVEGRHTTAPPALGGRVRWVAATRPTDPVLAARLDRFANVGAFIRSTSTPEAS